MANLNIGNSTANVKVTLNQNGDVHFRNGTLDFDESSMPQFSGTPSYLVGVESIANGGTLKWASKSNISVGTADKFTSAKSITLTGDVTGTTSSQAGWSIATTASKLTRAEHLDTVEKLDAFIENNKLKYATVANIGGVASDGMIISVPWNNSWGHQIFLDDSAMVMQHRHRYTKTNSDGSTTQAWSGWATLLDSNNYNNYAPSKTGTGASGTWGISINGNAATATKWTTARTITLGSDASGSVAIDGSANVILNVQNNRLHVNPTGRPTSADINLYTSPGNSKLSWMYSTSAMTTNKPPTGDGIIINTAWDWGGAGTQLSISNAGHLSVRGADTIDNGESANPRYNSKWSTWNTILDSGNYNNYTLRKISSSTDNAIARWDGADGKSIQNSGILIDDNNNLLIGSGRSIYFNNSASGVHITNHETSYFLQVLNGLSALPIATGGIIASSNYSDYSKLPNNGIFSKGNIRTEGNLYFTNGNNEIRWDEGTYQQRILNIDDSNADTSVFTFQQSTNSGSSWDSLLSIRDNGKIILQDKIGGIYRLDASATMMPVIQISNNNVDTTILRIDGDNRTSHVNTLSYGFELNYRGTGGGEDNALELISSCMGSTTLDKTLSIANNGKVGIGGKYNTNYRFAVTGTSYFSDLVTINTGNNSHKGIKLASTYINAINKDIIFQDNNTIRFGADDWNYDKWAGLKYDSNNKIISLGIADGSEFIANTAQSGGILQFPGVDKLYLTNKYHAIVRLDGTSTTYSIPRQDGNTTTITTPNGGSSSQGLLLYTAENSSDYGAFYLGSDGAVIANSGDNTYVLKVYDKDKGSNFNTNTVSAGFMFGVAQHGTDNTTSSILNTPLTMGGYINPRADNTYALGTNSYRWKDLALSRSIQANNRYYPIVNNAYGSVWYKVTFPWAGQVRDINAWFMTSMDIIIGGPYAGGTSATVHLAYYFYYNGSNHTYTADNVYGSSIGTRLGNIVIKYDLGNPGIMYVKASNNYYNGIAINNLMVHDSARAYDFKTTTIQAIAEADIPSTANKAVPITPFGSDTGSANGSSYVLKAGDTMTGNLTAPSVYTSNWFRSTGSTGWYNESYGGGWYMTDSNFIRNYNSKALSININSNNACGIGGHRLATVFKGNDHVSILLSTNSLGYGLGVNNDGNWYWGKRTTNSETSTSGDSYVLYGSTNHISPYSTDTMDLGASNRRWRSAHIYRDFNIYGNESTGDESHIKFNASDRTQRAIITFNGNVDNTFNSNTHLKIATSFGDIRLAPANGNVNIGDGNCSLTWRKADDGGVTRGLESGVYFSTLGRESVVFANRYTHTGWIFANGIRPSDKTNWNALGVTPAMQIHHNAVYINRPVRDADTSDYNLYVNGTSYFNGNTTHNGIDYFANGTAYYIDNNADAYLRRGLFAGTSNSDTEASEFFRTGALEIRESGRVGNSQSSFNYAPRIGFHWSNRIAATLSFHSDGNFYLRKQNGSDRATLDANLNGNAATATNADKTDDYHLSEGGVPYKYINTINQPTANTVWYLKISTSDWNGDNEIIKVYARGNNRNAKIIIYSGSRQTNWHAYATQYNGTCCNGIKKVISSCDNVYIRLDSETTSVIIYTTFNPTITTTTDTDGYTNIPTEGGLFGNNTTFDKVYGAVWNDYAEYRKTNHEIEPGRCVIEVGDGSLTLSFGRLQPGANIVSDTFGFAIGETEINKTPLAVSGRVLAYPNEPRESYHPGDPVCSGPNGTISRMTREEVREWPDRIVGTVSEIPNYETWGTGNVEVNGRIWIKVK